MPAERRRHGRFKLWLPVVLEVQDQELVAVTHDMSRRGALLVTDARLDVGARARLSVRIPPHDGEESSVDAEVVRCTPNHEDPTGLWPFEVALIFAEEAPTLEARLHEMLAEIAGS